MNLADDLKQRMNSPAIWYLMVYLMVGSLTSYSSATNFILADIRLISENIGFENVCISHKER